MKRNLIRCLTLMLCAVVLLSTAPVAARADGVTGFPDVPEGIWYVQYLGPIMKAQAKMGVNEKEAPPKTPVSFVLLDDRHLTERGVRYFCARSKLFVLITSNAEHPAFGVRADNLRIIFQARPLLPAALERLKSAYGCERLTVQSGGTVNGLFLRQKLIDYLDIVVAPVLVGGRDTPTLIDGEAIASPAELSELGALRLIGCEALRDSYVRLRYEVLREETADP